jgi:hypothetical protein
MAPVRTQVIRLGTPIFLLTLLTLSWVILRINNGAWERAGQESQAITRSLDELYKHTACDPSIFLLGLPDTLDGAYVCRNAVHGMTGRPQTSRDVKNCFMLDNSDRIFPFGMARGPISSSDQGLQILTWDSEKKTFIPSPIPKPLDTYACSWSKESLKTIIEFGKEDSGGPGPIWRTDGSVTLNSNANPKRRPELVVNLTGIPCFAIEFLSIKLRCPRIQANDAPGTVSLLYTNDLEKKFDSAHRLDATLKDTPELQTVSFPLHGQVSWAMGGKCHQLQFLFPRGCQCDLKSISVQPARLMMPQLSLRPSVNQNVLGFIELNEKNPAAEIDFDCHSLPGASSIALEFTKPNGSFEFQNTSLDDRSTGIIKLYPTTSGKIPLGTQDFPTSGIYEARLRALDWTGKPVGFAGDHILLTVNR